MIITKLSTCVENFVDNFMIFNLKGCFVMQINKDELFAQAQELLKDEMSPIAFETWIKTLEITEMTNDNIVFKAVSEYHRDLIKSRYSSLILNTFKYLTNLIKVRMQKLKYRIKP